MRNEYFKMSTYIWASTHQFVHDNSLNVLSVIYLYNLSVVKRRLHCGFLATAIADF